MLENKYTIHLEDGEESVEQSFPAHLSSVLPCLEDNERGVFLGWNRYAKLNFGRMNFIATRDETMYAIRTTDPVYLIKSHFRGDPENVYGPRQQFRRYVVDVYLDNSDACSGTLKLDLHSNIFYYLGHVPCENVNLTVKAITDVHGHSYQDEAYFTTSTLTLNWESDASMRGRQIARLMFAFSRWGMDYGEIMRRTSDDILMPDLRYAHMAGDIPACVSANFYSGVCPEIMPPTVDEDANVEQVHLTEQLPTKDMGELLCRYALLADTHVGVRYNWPNYDWLYRVYDHLEEIHAQNPLDFIVELGDNIDDGYEKTYARDYAIYLDVVKRLHICDAENPIENRREGTIPHYELQGNHDTSMNTRFFREKLWYTENAKGIKTAHISFFTNYGGYPAVHFTIAGSYESYCSYGIITDKAVAFIENSIIQAKENGAEQVVLYSHFGIAQDLSGPILPETGLGKIALLCQKYNIRLFFNGHLHNKAYSLKKYETLYDYDTAMTCDGYAVAELYTKGVILTVYDTETNSVVRTDRITF